jgi:DNA mismatch repair protein MutL
MFEQPKSGGPAPMLESEASSLAVPTRPVRSAIQLHNTYLVCETDDGLVIIDQHALHERVLYNQLRDRITDGRLESQRLLLPETLHVTSEQLALLDTHAELLDQLGLEYTPFGKDSVAIQSFPAFLKDTDVVGFVRDLLDKLAQYGDRPQAEGLIHEALDMMACKAAVKAGDPLTREEVDALISRRDLIEKSSNCPHGRPTALRLTVKDLERQFKRT